jgi:hypothetical protein
MEEESVNRAAVLAYVALIGATVVASARQQIPRAVASSVNWTESRETRRHQAAEWLAEVSAIEVQIPTLSPAEQAWLKTEYDDELARNHGAYTPRSARARHSKEGSAHFAKPIAAEIVLLLRQLAATTPLTQQREVALWSQLCYRTLDLNFWGDIASLGEHGVVARDPQSRQQNHQQALHQTWALRVHEILRAIVVPYVSRAG